MDLITENLIKDFISSNELNVQDLDDQFELFCCFSILSKEYGETFDVENVWLNDESFGIDGIAILVNGRLVENKEEIDDLADFNKYLDATFVFIQSKTSSAFDSKEIGNYIYGVLDFFEDKPKIPRKNNLKEKSEIVKHIYAKSAFMRTSPVCKVYFITTGVWKDDPIVSARLETGKQDLLQRNLFSKVEVSALDARSIQKLYQNSKAAISTEIIFANKTVLPEINGVEQAYVGTLDFKEFIKLITDSDGKILNSVFYDNVRAFQGENSVNKKIKETLESKKFDKFPILNNGITIVAKSLKTTGNKFRLNDYSVVNGCQTSHVIFNARKLDGIDKMSIPIRIIVTDDEEVRDEVIRATNNQTQVKPEELEALSDFQKSLEMFYLATEGDLKLFYERRSKQFSNSQQIIKTRIITIPIQIKSFAAMFLEEPHSVSRFYGRIVKLLGTQIFSKDHKQIIYYTAALAFFRLDQQFRYFGLNPKYKKCKYHLLMMLPYVVHHSIKPRLSSGKIETYCFKIINALKTTESSRALFEDITRIVDKSGVDIDNRDAFKLQSTNDALLQSFLKNITKKV